MTNDIVYFDATASDKTALLEFVNASIADLEEYQVEMSCAGANQDALEAMHRVISEQSDNDRPIAMRPGLFGNMATAALAWKHYGFDVYTPEEYFKLRASKETVVSILAVRDECYGF